MVLTTLPVQPATTSSNTILLQPVPVTQSQNINPGISGKQGTKSCFNLRRPLLWGSSPEWRLGFALVGDGGEGPERERLSHGDKAYT